MNLTACGNATVPEKIDKIRIATARMLLEAENIFSPARTYNSPQSALGACFQMAVNRKLPKNRWNLDPGLKGKTKFEEQSHLKRFWNDSQKWTKFWIQILAGWLVARIIWQGVDHVLRSM